MNWYYVHSGRKVGPVDDFQLADLRRREKIQGDTLIWCDGMEDWQPYSKVDPKPPARTETPSLPTSTTPETSSDTTHTAKEAVCSSCGRIFEITAMTQFGESRVCSDCRPAYTVKLAEEARAGLDRAGFAGFWVRGAALALDGFVLSFVFCLLTFAIARSVSLSALPPAALTGVALLETAISIGYETFLVGKYGATLGKRYCKVKVVRADGLPLSYPHAFCRSLVKPLSGMFCCIGFLLAAFDPQNRALHDRLCRTRVVPT